MSEIKLSDYIRNYIRKIRTENKVKGIVICNKMKKHPSFISHIENGIVKTVELEDLKNIINSILGITGDELEECIDELLNKSDELKASANSNEELFILDEEYDTKTDDVFKQMIDNMNEGFLFAFKKKRNYTFINLSEFVKNLHFDLGFMMGLISIPFYRLDGIDFEIRKKLFSDINNTVKKYLEEYGKEDDSVSSNSNSD